MPRNRHLPGWRFLRFITIVTVYDPICNVIRIGLTSLPGGVANRLPLLQRHCQITTFFDAAQYRPPRDGAAFFLLFLWFAAVGAGRFAPPRKGAASRRPSPSASRGGRKRRITLTYPPQSRKIARNRTTLGRKWEEISCITADAARFSGKRRKSPGRPARRFLFALCAMGSGVFSQYTTSSFPGAKARSAARQMRSVQPSTPKRAVLSVMS